VGGKRSAKHVPNGNQEFPHKKANEGGVNKKNASGSLAGGGVTIKKKGKT